jgi:hypothetical protein
MQPLLLLKHLPHSARGAATEEVDAHITAWPAGWKSELEILAYRTQIREDMLTLLARVLKEVTLQ